MDTSTSFVDVFPLLPVIAIIFGLIWSLRNKAIFANAFFPLSTKIVFFEWNLGLEIIANLVPLLSAASINWFPSYFSPIIAIYKSYCFSFLESIVIVETLVSKDSAGPMKDPFVISTIFFNVILIFYSKISGHIFFCYQPIWK